MYETLISTERLAENLNNPEWVVVDCSYELTDKEAGFELYQAGHIPGAVFAHTFNDLSGPPLTDNGRHPLPSPEQLIDLFSRLGISRRTQVIAYDNRGITAARLWWLMRYMGHEPVAVLDGGRTAWIAEDRPLVAGIETRARLEFSGSPNREQLVVMDEVLKQQLLVDSRDAARYRGESAGGDAAAGHIPGALNRHHKLNRDEDMKLRDAKTLRREFQELFGDIPSEDVTFYCGSGISACVNLLTLAHIGMQPGKLYVGSWSEWSKREEQSD